MVDNLADTLTVLDPGENEGAIAAHLRAVAFHDCEVGSDRLGEIGLVDDEQVGLRDTGAAFAGDLVSA